MRCVPPRKQRATERKSVKLEKEVRTRYAPRAKKRKMGYAPPRKQRATERKSLKLEKEVRTQHELGTYLSVDFLTSNPRINIFCKK